MNVIVADACPIILLAKLDRLSLIRKVFPGTILLPSGVLGELTWNGIPPDEQRRIHEFVTHCRIEPAHPTHFAAAALSAADRQVLTLATRHPKSVILTDDSLIRRIAEADGIRVAGTLGLVIRAARARLITRPEALRAVDALVAHHQLRVSVALYQETLRQIRQT